MKINPIMPIWLMSIICVMLCAIVIFFRRKKNGDINTKKISSKKGAISSIIIKILIIILLFIINLRIMIPNGDEITINSNISVLFVIDTSTSMRALDYDGNNERYKGLVSDCCNIVDNLSGCKFSIITFGNIAKKVIPFTRDGDTVQAELKAIDFERFYLYNSESSLNLPKETISETLSKESENQNGEAKFIIFFISDGEITKDEKLESYSDIKQYISNGAVLGYGTSEGGKMLKNTGGTLTNTDYDYVEYKGEVGISKIDEDNLNNIASDLGIDYIHMNKASDIDYKLKEIADDIYKSQTEEERVKAYSDIYYYLAIILEILLIVDFIIMKRRIQ